ASHANAVALRERLAASPGVAKAFDAPVFHEFVLKLDAPAGRVLRALRAHGILGGVDLAAHYPELGAALLVCATETKTEDDLERYAGALSRVMAKARGSSTSSER